MIARVATFDEFTADDRTWVAKAVESIPGLVGVFQLTDPDTGQSLSISFYESEDAVTLATKAVEARRLELGLASRGWDRVQLFDVSYSSWKGAASH
ncbi:MAG: hypothetical protein ACXVD9_11455 [Actinomycetota bacterium]